MEKKDPLDEELVAATPTQRNWRGILISLLVIGVVSSLIVTCVILLTPPDLGPRIQGNLVTLEDVVGSVFRVIPDGAEWVTGEDLAFRDDAGGVSVINARNQSVRVLVSNTTLQRRNRDKPGETEVERFLVSPDLESVIIVGHEKRVTQYTSEAKYWLWDVKTGHMAALRPDPWSVDQSHPSLQHVTWVRSGSDPGRGGDSALLMVHEGDIFYKERAVSPDSYRVTKSGVPGVVYNGVPELLYAEHILRSSHAVWPSPGGTLLLYFTLNCTDVEDLQYTTYETGAKPHYPHVHSIKYPRAGSTNPTLTVTIANVSQPRTISYHTVQPPDSLANRELYAAGVSWLDERQVSVTWYRRRQNTSYVTVCSAPSWHCHTIYQSQAASGWVSIRPGPLFSAEKGAAILLDRVSAGPDTLHTQIMMVDIRSRSVTQMTQASIDVEEILAWRAGYIYYMSGVASSPGQRHLYRVSDQGSPLERTPKCLTCPEDPCEPGETRVQSTSTGSNSSNGSAVGEPCLQYEAVFSRAGYYALRCVGPSIPQLFLRSDTNTAATLVKNYTRLRQAASNTSLPNLQLLTVPVKSGGAATVKLHVPPQYRAGDAAVFPLLLRLNQPADHRWRVDHATYLAEQLGFAVADVALPSLPPVEAESTRSVGLGVAEVAALRQVIAHLTATLDYVTPVQVLALGRGWAGYLALSLLADTEELRCAVAIAPVTNWHIYASAAAERRLGRPAGNHRGYWDSDLGHRAEQLAGRRLMLVHGTADTSVSVQHTFLLARQLERASGVFRQMVYPDEDHQLSGVEEHMIRTLDHYFNQCLLPDNVKELVSEEI